VTSNPLSGNGVALVRELSLAKRVQAALERLYQLEAGMDLAPFIRKAEGDEREALLVRENAESMELSLRVPELSQARAFDLEDGGSLDALCQIIEGVSHFVYLTNRAEAQRETTQLELEVQAEVDKYVVLSASVGDLTEARSRRVRERLFERVTYVHNAHTDEGQRYRAANDCARRFARRLEREFIAPCRFGELHSELRRFYRMGQADKLRAA
jgi:hypothetical protein